jgi:hypothetical protein
LSGFAKQPQGAKDDWIPNVYMATSIMSLIVASEANAAAEDGFETDDSNSSGSRAELDSHASMVVVGRNCLVVHDTGRES